MDAPDGGIVTERRYQECGLIERAWRRRHQLRVPFDAIRWWWRQNRVLPVGKRDSFGITWDIAMWMADFRMRWYYTMAEVLRDEGREES